MIFYLILYVEIENGKDLFLGLRHENIFRR